MGNHNRIKEINSKVHFDRLMFGSRREVTKKHHKIIRFNNTSLDFAKLLDDIEELIDTAENMKPLLNKVYPYVQQFLKK